MVNIVVAKKSTTGVISTTAPVTLKNVPTLASGEFTRLDHLQDVNATNEVNGAVPVYDSTIDKYVVKKVDLGDVSGNLDGGTF